MRSSRTIRLDVRPYHERGEEPFDAIMSAVEGLKDRDQFLLINSFEPKPLYAVMRKRGFSQTAVKIGENEWRVLIKREQSADAEKCTPAAQA